MFVGHALLAFAVAALVAERRGWNGRRALLVGAVAGAFAAVPDIDVAYALVGLADWRLLGGSLGAPAAFWDASRAVHRSATHSLVVGVVAAPAFALFVVRDSSRARIARLVGGGLLAGLVALALVVDGPLSGFVMALFAASGVLVAAVAARRTSLSPAAVALAALWGLWSHPWGDLVTGSPPEWLYPLESSLLASRVVLHADPTLHLLGAFAIELATIWLALAAVCRLTDRSPLALVDRRAGAGVAYGLVALAATPPTLAVSYHFVFSILVVGALCGVSCGVPSTTALRADGGRSVPIPAASPLLERALTAVGAVTVALLAYATVYTFVAPL
ncbi:metal-dependent hydrolase [Halopiger aswanensis]|uniref:LexA-binding, inner membrane-associated putative hydrolase n=1 Tax=Halopiger aswanensis TaxID=148449 RepID=A0A419WNK3_9EURY|nr:metal-dependent hydrolase [Halopiger aswanensis]RKD97029.1 LexA-binding, inner membrane-associated putative hydrolase [Halopiger aswanensis]